MYPADDRRVLDRSQLGALFAALQRRSYRIVGPTLREGAIVFDVLESPADLPVGWTDVQDGGSYRLERRNDEALFGYAVGPHSWKQFLLPPLQRMRRATQQDGERHASADVMDSENLAFVGVRSCDLRAIGIQDTIHMGGAHVDRMYASRRSNIFIVALNCSHAGNTCFCVSMGTGPRAEQGFDLALTEVIDEDRHYLVVDVGTDAGKSVLDEVPNRKAEREEADAANAVVATTAAHMGRALDTTGIKELLYSNLEHSRWDDVASRCLTCGNCTMVCPTCFCYSVEDVADLTGESVQRERRWESCFATEFTYTAGKPIRSSARSRYRQWLTHKLAFWIDQFGMSGCVGCGRCITWCPVGIDITEEVAAIRATDGRAKSES